MKHSKELKLASEGLLKDLQKIDPSNLAISGYGRWSLSERMKNLGYKLSRDEHFIEAAISRSNKPLDELVLLDYGGGVGLISLLAKRLGVGTVIYSDISGVALKDLREIANTLGCQADYYVEGDINSLVDFCAIKGVKCDAILSYDVLEHIYDIDEFCKKLCSISREGTTMIHSSGANIFCPPMAKLETEAHILAETKGLEEQWGEKRGEFQPSYLELRKRIIREHFPDLDEKEIDELAIHTRGMIQNNILEYVDSYIKSGSFPQMIEHPTNTCYPYTGEWLEHLMNPHYLKETLSHYAFDVRLLSAYSFSYLPLSRTTFVHNVVLRMVYPLFRLFPTCLGLYYSPYYSLYARYNGRISIRKHKHHIYRYGHSPLFRIHGVLWTVVSCIVKMSGRIKRFRGQVTIG